MADAVVITGVSTGIGHAAAAELCRLGYRVFGSVRRQDDAERLQREFGTRFTPLVFDVTDAAAIKAAAALVEAAIGERALFGLVNNAGIANPGPLSLIPAEVVRQHFEVNVIGALNMIQAFLPQLRRDKGAGTRPGRIVNVSSVSGRIAFPFIGPYAASKHALEALSDSLRRELMIYGVDVVVIEPGAIDTPIWDKGAHIKTAFAASDYAPALRKLDFFSERRRPVDAVVRRIVTALTATRPKTRYVIPDRWFKLWLGPRLLPDRLLDRIVDRMLDFRAIRKDLDGRD